MRQICILNRSTRLDQATLSSMVSAIQKGLDRDFEPIWQTPCLLYAVTFDSTLNVRTLPPEVIHVLDDTAHARILGFHQMRKDGTPEGFALIDESPLTLVEFCGTLDHEIKEQLINPLARDAALVKLPYWFGGLSGSTALVMKEVVDPVENDWYSLDGWQLGNFVKPLWFTEVQKADFAAYDFLGKLAGPLTVSAGGYFLHSTEIDRWQEYGARLARKHEYTRNARIRYR